MKNKNQKICHPELGSGSNKKAFTLMELIVVIIVLATLSIITFPKFTGVMSDTRHKEAVTLLKKLDSAVLLYYMDHPDHDIEGGPIVNFAMPDPMRCSTVPGYESIFTCGYIDELPSVFADSDNDFYVCNPYNTYVTESNYCQAVKYAVMVDDTNCYGYDDDGDYIEIGKTSCAAES